MDWELHLTSPFKKTTILIMWRNLMTCEQEFSDWVDIDCDLQVSTVLTDEEIVYCIINQSKEEEGEEENKDEPK
jgi:hypothetical protein